MVKYKVNIKFKEDGRFLNDKLIEVLKIELEKHYYMIGNILNNKVPLEVTHYPQSEGSSN